MNYNNRMDTSNDKNFSNISDFVRGSGNILAQNNCAVNNPVNSRNNTITPRYASGASIRNSFNNQSNLISNLQQNSYNQSADKGVNILNRNFNNAIIANNRGNKNIITGGNHNIVSSLTGEKINSNKFLNPNIKPFYTGSNVKQNIENDTNKSILDSHNGSNYYRTKKENEPLFSPIIDINSKYGTQSITNNARERVFSSRFRSGELPFEQVHVGKGLNSYDAKPTGGFHPDYRDHILPKSIDELRAASNPKITYKGVFKAGKELNSKRGKLGNIEKRTADTYFVQKQENYLRTTGAYTKAEQRPAIYIKDNNRKYSVNYTPSANPIIKGNKHRSLYKKSTKNILETDTSRNLHKKNAWNDGNFGDYGKDSIANKTNERTTTEEKNPLSNFSSIAKAIIAPLMDVLRPTKKENFIGNNRQSGNMNTNVPKISVKDPNDIARTTLKETNIENSHTGNLTGESKNQLQYGDKAKTTVKETSENNSHNGNLTGSTKANLYNPNDIVRTTIKETNIDNSHTGYLKGPVKLTTYDPNDHLPETKKQLTSNFQYAGPAENEHRGLGYITNVKTAPNTNRQTTSDREYGGSANSFYKKTTSYDTDYNATINESKERTLKGRKPTPESVKLTNGVDKIHMSIGKIAAGRANNRKPNKDISYLTTYTDTSIHNRTRHQYNNNILDEQINPILLKPFKNNPYTHPLSSI